MTKRNVIISSILLVMVFSTLLLAACSTSPGASPTQTAAPSNGQTLLQDRCTVCHSTRRITTSHFSPEEWTQVVDAMVNRGAILSDQEKQTLIEYLAQTYP